MFFVYILKSSKNKWFYIGSTSDLNKRLEEHNLGKVVSTNFYRPLKLIYYEAYFSEKDARHREHNLKLKSRAFAQLKKRLKSTLENA
ncbi:MAG: GIY-YIG nuclease family protein [Patescibacteria group bacterium]|nr:GIY-YIG nuclease family protein [Patescibacteria group bacterium]MDD5164495.1 GIY-YIG nuclease family protein [Patescibacteria group bacterium]MDD5534145.1 GIY-YIG nuclease family protein [Patescibacteria group bacterium]